MSSHSHQPVKAEDPALAPPSDAANPALADARKTFNLTLALTVLFIGTVVFFIL